MKANTIIRHFAFLLATMATFSFARAGKIITPNSQLYYYSGRTCELEPLRKPSRIQFSLFSSIPSAPDPIAGSNIDFRCLEYDRRPQMRANSTCRAKSLADIYSPAVVGFFTSGGLNASGSQTIEILSHSLEQEALKSNYCQTKLPSTRKQIFEPENDVPADFINLWTETYLMAKWRVAKVEKDENLDAIYELNIAAAQLWSDMVACSGGDAEQARANYFRGKWLCSGGDYTGEEIKKRITLFLVNTKNVISTSRYFEPKLKSGTIWGYTNAITAGYDAVTRKGPLPSAHPLFIQAVLQTLIDFIPFNSTKTIDDLAKELKGQSEGESMSILVRRFKTATQVFDMLPQGKCVSYGLWPTANVAVQNAVRTRFYEMIAGSKTFFPDGGQVKDYGFLSNNCNRTKLPELYHDEMMLIAIDVGQIEKRYGL